MKHARIGLRTVIGAGLVLTVASMTAACSSDFSSGSSTASSGSGALTVMIGSSGPAETTTVQAAAKAYTKKTGTKVTVIPAQDLTQQLGQAFAGGNPPDLFYLDPSHVGQYAEAGNLYAYGKDVDLSQYDKTTLESYTWDGQVQCVPKESAGVLALSINTDMWKAAGLTAADYPKTWDQLHAVAKKLTTPDHVGLSMSTSRDRVGAFMVGAGGWYLNDDNTKVIADSPQNLQALDFLQSMLQDGSMQWASGVGASWGGEAFGMGKAAMTVEGGWLPATLASDYPNIKYTTIPMPAGPAGIGTLNFSNCWGISAKSKNHQEAVDLVNFLEEAPQAEAAAKGFGSTPAKTSLDSWTRKNYPDQIPYLDNLDHSKGQVSVPGFDSVLSNFDSQLEGLKTGNPEQILQSLQSNAEAALKQSQATTTNK